MKRVINFYGQDNEYGYYSNFSPHPIVLFGKCWLTVEHFYQAMKFNEELYQEAIRDTQRPGKAKRMGNEKTPFEYICPETKEKCIVTFKEDWADLKDDVMRVGVYAKFTQHLDLQQKMLVDDADADLVEHTVNDKYWGDGGDGSGKNMLGKVLMETRNRLNMESIFS
jgi:N-glycosidase YbiA